jgi:hypothetical protein
MKFSDVIAPLMSGKRIRKTNWGNTTAYLVYDKEHNTFDFYEVVDGQECRTRMYTTLELTSKDLLSDFWEVVK